MESSKTQRVAGIIPARYASSRFPGKPLAILGGKPMIRMVYEKATAILSEVYVATDDERIEAEVKKFGGKVIMTSPSHRSGTDRCAEAAVKIGELTGNTPDVIINIQGDEPFIKPEQIEALKNCFNDPLVEIATLIRRVRADEDIDNPNQPKVVIDNSGNALYFSRSVIPFQRDVPEKDWAKSKMYYKHIGIYGYTFKVLRQISQLKQTPLEIAESLEQVRWLENGYRIRTAVTDWESIGIDTPEDLVKAERLIDRKQ